MSPKEQERRRALKRERKALDRAIGQLAAAAKPVIGAHLPSTRSKQAKWHHELARSVHNRIDAYRSVVARMREIEATLAHEETQEPYVWD